MRGLKLFWLELARSAVQLAMIFIGFVAVMLVLSIVQALT